MASIKTPIRQYAAAFVAATCAFLASLILQVFLGGSGELGYVAYLGAAVLMNAYGGTRTGFITLALSIAATTASTSLLPVGGLNAVAGFQLLVFGALGSLILAGQSAIRRRRFQAYPTPLRDVQNRIIGGVNMLIDVTEQRRSEEALRESEERFRVTFHQTALGMAQSDAAGRFLLVNDRYSQLTGYSREELLNMSLMDLTHPDDVEITQQQLQLLLAGEVESYTIEKRYLRKDQETRWVQVSASLIRDGDGRPQYVIAGVQDMSDQKRKEEALRLLVDLNLAMQPLVEPKDIMDAAARLLGEHLNADRCAYAEVEADEDHFTVTGDYTRGVSSIEGRFAMSAFGEEALRLMRAGQAYVVNDAGTDPRVTDPAAYHATQIQAVVCVPLHKAGRFVAGMAVHQSTPRHWTAGEVGLIQLAVARCWESIERARTLRSLQESEKRLRFVLDSMPQKIFTTTPAGELDYLNPQWLSFAGMTLEEIKHWGRAELVHPDDLERNQVAWQRSIQSGEPLQLEHRFRQADGEYRWHVTRVLPVRDDQGRVILWIGSNTDIHDVKSAQEAAVKRSDQVRRLAQLATRLNTTREIDPIIDMVTESARTLIPAHQAVASLTVGPECDQVIRSRSLSDKYAKWRDNEAPLDDSAIYATVCEANKPMRLTQAELEMNVAWKGYRKDAGKHPPMRGWLAAPLVAGDGVNLGLIQLSDRLEGEFSADDEAILVQLAQMASVAVENARLVEGLRLASRRKDEFLATLAHELRNPLAPMRNMLEVLKRDDSDKEVLHKARATIEQQLLHMVRLIDDLLDVSRVTRGKLELRLEQVELQGLLNQVLDSVRSLVDCSGYDLKVELPATAVFLEADPTRLMQIFSNLLDNAIKYTAPGGTIWVKAERMDDSLLVTVRDSGIGIPADRLNDIFDMFSQVDQSLERQHSGLGIGLTLVKRLVEMHGGTINAHSAGLGKGTEFRVCLPIRSASSAETPSEPGAQPAQHQARRVLVVDDNDVSASSLAMLLEAHGNDTRTANDGLEALAVAEGFRPDIVLLDIGMPKLNGYDACRRLRQQPWGRHAVIIAISGWGQEQDRQKSLEAGFDHHLVKPVDFSALVALLKSGETYEG